MHIFDGACVHILDVHVQSEKDEGLVKDLEVERVNQDDQADAVVECRKVLDQKDLDVQEVMAVPSLLGSSCMMPWKQMIACRKPTRNRCLR